MSGARNLRQMHSTFCLVQLREGENIHCACKRMAAVPGVAVASSVSGLFDIIAKIISDAEGTTAAIAEIRSLEIVEFAGTFETGVVYLAAPWSARQESLIEEAE